jgi:glycosyltransferase involved in cell wall biosynthesis
MLSKPAEQLEPVVSRRVCIISSKFSRAADEGINKYAVALAEALSTQHDVLWLATTTPKPGSDPDQVRVSRSFLSGSLRKQLRAFDPDVIFYLPTASTTLWSFVRSRILKLYCPRATVAMVGLQPRQHSSLAQRLIPRIAPDVVFVQSTESKGYLESLGCRAAMVASGVDTDTFRPVSPSQRAELRAKYGLTSELPIVLHAGHLNAGRGITTLADLAATRRCQPVLVASTSTEQDPVLEQELRDAGVIVFGTFQPNVEELYQLADSYLFPVRSAQSAIEAPLSVLEALACDLPVVTTPFGGLPRMFAGVSHPGLVFSDSPCGLVAETLRICKSRVPGTRELAVPYSWDAVASRLVKQALASSSSEMSFAYA